MCTDEHMNQLQALAEIEKTLRKQLIRQADFETIQISSTNAWIANYAERRHLYFFSTIALQLSCEEFGTYTLPAQQWCEFDLRQGIKITAVNQTNLVALQVKHSDELMNAPTELTVAAAGSFSPVSPPTNTNASADTPLTMPVRCNHFLIQNNSGALLYVELDAAASTASIQIPSGSSWRDDIQVTVIHFYTVAGQALTGYVVRGWL